MRWQIICDFDGTITLNDCRDAIIGEFATGDWQQYDELWAKGEMGSRETLPRQVALMEGDTAALDKFIDQVEIDPGFPAFVAEADRLGLPLTIVSDGFDYAIRRVLQNHKIDNLEIVSNRLTCSDNKFAIDFPNTDADCAVEAATCKCRAVGRLRSRRTLFIGNGQSDFCPAEAAQFVLAKDSLVGYCRSQNLPHRAFSRFTEITGTLALIANGGDEIFTLDAADREVA